MNIALLGSTGQFGSWLLEAARTCGRTLLTPEIRLSDREAFRNYCQEQQVDAVINAAGWNNRRCQHSDVFAATPDSAVKVNSRWPGKLTQVCSDMAIPFYHISTEYVFSVANGEGPFDEAVDPLPRSLYGQTKLLGDLNVLQAGGHVLRVAVLPDCFPCPVAATNLVSSKLRASEGCRRVIQFVSRGLQDGARPRLLHICGERRSIADFVRDELKQDGVCFAPLLDDVVRPADSSLASLFPQDLL